MKRAFLQIVIVFALLAWGCNQEQVEKENEMLLTEKSAQLINANNQFGFDLFQQVFASELKADNVMISPVSVALALAMTYNGAETSTKTAMEKTLRLYGLTPDDINQSYQSLVEGLQSLDPKVLIEVANAIFYRNDFQVENNFVTINQQYYKAEVAALNFSSPAALQTINGWVSTKTKGKIPEIIKEIKPTHMMFLLNAIWFKGAWGKEFNPKNTTQGGFTNEEGLVMQAGMMHRTDTLDYASTDLFSAIRLPYGRGQFNMYVFLPEPGKTLQNLVSQLDKQNWQTWLDQFAETKTVDISFPRFKFPYEIELNDVLTEMGMGIAFGGEADFRGINRDGGLNIDYVKHKTFVDVNEEGTEAAAVTVVAIEKLMAPQKVIFHVNRPFLFVITEKKSGALLFIGTVKKPVYE